MAQSFAPLKTSTSAALHRSRTSLNMSGNKAKFGIFSPAVYAAKFVLGEAKLNKVCQNLSVVIGDNAGLLNRSGARPSVFIAKPLLNGV